MSQEGSITRGNFPVAASADYAARDQQRAEYDVKIKGGLADSLVESHRRAAVEGVVPQVRELVGDNIHISWMMAPAPEGYHNQGFGDQLHSLGGISHLENSTLETLSQASDEHAGVLRDMTATVIEDIKLQNWVNGNVLHFLQG